MNKQKPKMISLTSLYTAVIAILLMGIGFVLATVFHAHVSSGTVSDWILALLTGVLAFSTISLVQATKQLSSSTEEATKKVSGALLFVSSGEIKNAPGDLYDQTHPTLLIFDLHNEGKTLAKDVNIAVETFSKNCPMHYYSQRVSLKQVVPEHPQRVEFLLTEDQLRAFKSSINDAADRTQIIGSIKFQDAFDDVKPSSFQREFKPNREPLATIG